MTLQSTSLGLKMSLDDIDGNNTDTSTGSHHCLGAI